MSKLRTILLVGPDTRAIEAALQAAGFTSGPDFQIVAVSDTNGARHEVTYDHSIVAAIVTSPNELREIRRPGAERSEKLPIVVCWQEIDARDLLPSGPLTRVTADPYHVPGELRALLGM